MSISSLNNNQKTHTVTQQTSVERQPQIQRREQAPAAARSDSAGVSGRAESVAQGFNGSVGSKVASLDDDIIDYRNCLPGNPGQRDKMPSPKTGNPLPDNMPIPEHKDPMPDGMPVPGDPHNIRKAGGTWQTENDETGMSDYDRFQSYDYDTQDLIIEKMTENQCGYEDIIIVGNNKGDDNIKVTPGEDGGIVVNVNGEEVAYTAEEAARMVIAGGAGNDKIEIDPSIKINMAVAGGMGDDTIRGGAGNDDLRGGFGNDTIYGYGGDDKIYGGRGENTLVGGRGQDTYVLDDRDGDNDKTEFGAMFDGNKMITDKTEHIANSETLPGDVQTLINNYLQNKYSDTCILGSAGEMAEYAALMINAKCDDDYRAILSKLFSDTHSVNGGGGVLGSAAAMAQYAQLDVLALQSGDYTSLINLVGASIENMK